MYFFKNKYMYIVMIIPVMAGCITEFTGADQLHKICYTVLYAFSAVHLILLPSQKPSSLYSLLKIVYVTSQLSRSLV